MMPTRGPAAAFISSGRPLDSPVTERAATGSTRTFQTGWVSTSHSARDHAAVVLTPDGNAVVASSQWSARRTESATRSRSRWLGVGSGCCATCWRAMSPAAFQLSGPSCGCISDWSCWKKAIPPPGPNGFAPPGRPPPRAPKSCSKGVPLNGFGCSSPGSPGLLVMTQNYA